MSNSIFKKNMRVLKQRYPLLAKKVVATPIPKELKIFSTESRYYTLALDLYGKYAFFHSKINPNKEAKEQLSNFVIDDTVNVLVLGVGLGYHIAELSRKISPQNYVIIVEQYLPIFRLALSYIDVTSLLSNKRVYFFVDCKPEEIFESLKAQVFHISNNDLVVLRHDTSCLLFKDYYDVVEARVRELIVWARKNFDAGLRFRRLYQCNIIKNLYFYLNYPGTGHLIDLNVPCIIAAAGPSLDKAMDVLKSVNDRAIIISVDTAMYPLIRAGIKPHFVVSIDPHRINYMHFTRLNDDDMKDTALIIDPQVYYEIPRNYKGPVLVPTLQGSKIVEYFSDLVANKGVINKGMSVAHSAFSLAVSFGCSPVIFVGLDLSFPVEGTHVKGAANYKAKIESNRNILKVKGVDGKEVITDDVFYAYIKHFEIELSKIKTLCLNASAGAFIEGMVNISPKQIFNYMKDNKVNLSELLYAKYIKPDTVAINNKKLNLIKKVYEIKEKVNNLLSRRLVLKEAKRMYSDLRRYGLIIDILEENMEQAAFLLSNRKLWKNRKEIDKFKLYYESLGSSCDFIIEEVKNANFY